MANVAGCHFQSVAQGRRRDQQVRAFVADCRRQRTPSAGNLGGNRQYAVGEEIESDPISPFPLFLAVGGIVIGGDRQEAHDIAISVGRCPTRLGDAQ